jgi:hypothetical protein
MKQEWEWPGIQNGTLLESGQPGSGVSQLSFMLTGPDF